MTYEVHERCGCGATIARSVYPLAAADDVLREFRATHRHLEPLAPPATVRVSLRGNPRIRVARIMRHTSTETS